MNASPVDRRRLAAQRFPRLHTAWREYIVEQQRLRAARARAMDQVLKKRRLVAHRELQLARGDHRELAGLRDPQRRRAGARYVAERESKLAQARRELADAERHARDLGVTL